MITDPQSVVPNPRPAVAATQPMPPAQPSGQIGGRAMLAPGESVENHLARLHPTTTLPRPPSQVRSVQGLWDAVRGWSRSKQLALGGAGLAVILAVVLLLTLTGGGGGTPTVAGPAGATSARASFDTQDYRGNRAVSVKVPKGWKRVAAGNWVDYVDPGDPERKVRVLVEPGTITPRRFAENTAQGTLRNSQNCPKPFRAVAVTDVQVAGHPGAQLEYTCGSGPGMRHGIWRETTVNGRMYSFYLTSTDAQFTASKQIFDEMTRTFALTST
jgi:hypothetical protein